MKARHKRRTRRTQQNHSEAAALQRISNQLTRLQTPVDPDVLSGINAKLDRIELGLTDVQASATRRGAVAGAVAGTLTSSLVVTALMLIKARLGL
ncbi:MAG: hypothetical protein RR429_13225 [Hafnia sp.]